jgi:hypothetical protein
MKSTKLGTPIPSSIARMATVIISSISVNPREDCIFSVPLGTAGLLVAQWRTAMGERRVVAA